MILFSMPFYCFAQDADDNPSAQKETAIGMPSVELLEFLGRWETRHGDWMNPNVFADSEFGAILDGASLDNDNDNTGNSDTDDNNDNSDNSNDSKAADGANNG